MNKRLSLVLASLAAVGASTTASAAVDVSAIVTEISGGAAPIAAIGGAVLLILAGVKLWKLVRRAM